MFLLGLAIGLFAGAMLGVLLMAAVVAGSRADEVMGDD
jgi:hypothetical protein